MSFTGASPGLADLRFVLCRNFSELAKLAENPSPIALDIPIGLLDQTQPGGRSCDRAVRALLGRPTSGLAVSAREPVSITHEAATSSLSSGSSKTCCMRPGDGRRSSDRIISGLVSYASRIAQGC
ncbi:MAG: DUF429 domain-containing protein [Gammaproteobacteria bacterium]